MSKGNKYLPVLMVFCCLVCGLFSCALTAADVKTRFFEAENCYKALDQNPKQKRYRANWLNCIKKFKAVHDYDADGPWAAAGLYRAGVLYQELHRYSGRAADQQEAIALFEKIIADYPKSAYSGKSRQRLAGVSRSTPAKKAPAVDASKDTDAAKGNFVAAEACYRKLLQNTARKKYRCYWLDCINAFYDVYRKDPAGPWAAAGLYMAGSLYGELYQYSYRQADREEGRRLLRKVVSDFSGSAYSEKAAAELRETGAAGVMVAAEPPSAGSGSQDSPPSLPPDQTPAPEPEAIPATESGETVIIRELRYWSNPSYTRVVIDTTGPVEYTHNLLQGDPGNNKPPRLYIDLDASRLHQELSRQITIDDNLLKDIRAGQYTATSVRVVVDIKSFKGYKIFSLRDPFRVVIDVSGEGGQATTTVAQERQPMVEKSGKTSLAQQLGLTVRRIVIDPGHGGKDVGAPGYLKGVHEKQVVLDLARKLAERIEKELGCEVIMTRDTDRFLTLEERTAIANMKNADLFISIHTNASRNRDANGVETYILNLATDEDAMRVAAMENSTSQKNISDLQTILQDLMQNAKINESSRLAGYVQSALCGRLKKHYGKIKDKGVKQAPFYVLIGAQMPSILIETGFISNREECRRLTDPDYQRHICDGILQGIKAYIDQTTAAGFGVFTPGAS